MKWSQQTMKKGAVNVLFSRLLSVAVGPLYGKRERGLLYLLI